MKPTHRGNPVKPNATQSFRSPKMPQPAPLQSPEDTPSQAERPEMNGIDRKTKISTTAPRPQTVTPRHSRESGNPGTGRCAPTPSTVIPALLTVIPAKAGIQGCAGRRGNRPSGRTPSVPQPSPPRKREPRDEPGNGLFRPHPENPLILKILIQTKASQSFCRIPLAPCI